MSKEVRYSRESLMVLPPTQRLERIGELRDPLLESEYIDAAIGGVMRALNRREEFRTAIKTVEPDTGWIGAIDVYPADEGWTTRFYVGDVQYDIHHAAVIRPSKHYHTERVILERTEGSRINRGEFCSIPAHRDEKPHIWPRAEIVIGENEPLVGMPALIAMDEAFPELGLVWN